MKTSKLINDLFTEYLLTTANRNPDAAAILTLAHVILESGTSLAQVMSHQKSTTFDSIKSFIKGQDGA